MYDFSISGSVSLFSFCSLIFGDCNIWVHFEIKTKLKKNNNKIYSIMPSHTWLIIPFTFMLRRGEDFGIMLKEHKLVHKNSPDCRKWSSQGLLRYLLSKDFWGKKQRQRALFPIKEAEQCFISSNQTVLSFISSWATKLSKDFCTFANLTIPQPLQISELIDQVHKNVCLYALLLCS